MTASVSVVLAVFNRLALTRACLESLRPTTIPFELCVVDNASTDGTAEFFRTAPLPWPLQYERNDANVGLIRALNEGARLATGDLLCFLHNDTEMRDPAWLARLCQVLETGRPSGHGPGRGSTAPWSRVREAASPAAHGPISPGVGLAGLYGVRRVRRDGRYVGRTIVHALEDAPTLRTEVQDVAAVDGVCLVVSRDLLATVGGFDEGYGFLHGYDRDLSFAVREAGQRCVVVRALFAHRGGGTRTGVGAPVPAATDLTQRRAALARFATKWRHRLPADVRTGRERLVDWLAALPRRATLWTEP